MKIELFNRQWGMFQKTDSSHSAEIYSGADDNVVIVLLNGVKKPTPVAHITLNRGELMATLNFSTLAKSYVETPEPEES